MFRKFQNVAITMAVTGSALMGATGCSDGMAGGLLEGGLAGAFGGMDDQSQRAADPAPAAPAPPPAPAPAPVVLLQQTLGIAEVGAPGGAFLQFNPIATGRAVTIRVAGDVTGSRPTIVVFDPSIDIVVNEDNPVTNTAVGSFVPSAVGVHFVVFQELGAPASTYDVTITQN